MSSPHNYTYWFCRGVCFFVRWTHTLIGLTLAKKLSIQPQIYCWFNSQQIGPYQVKRNLLKKFAKDDLEGMIDSRYIQDLFIYLVFMVILIRRAPLKTTLMSWIPSLILLSLLLYFSYKFLFWLFILPQNLHSRTLINALKFSPSDLPGFVDKQIGILRFAQSYIYLMVPQWP